MSSNTSPSPGKTGSRTLIPESQSPIFLTTTSSQIYRHIHPILILSLSYFSFLHLVADPTTTLLSTAPPLALLQLIYCILCLPPWSSKPPPPPATKKDGTKDSKKAKDDTTPKPPKRVQFAKPPTTLSTKVVPALLSLALSLALSFPLTLLLILHGASLTTNHTGTFLLALHMALLTFPPLVYVHGVDRRMWREILTFSLPMDEVWGGVVGCVLGTVLGQVALPLDWDRVWQRWPVPLVVGAYVGWGSGRGLGEWGFKGWRIDFGAKGGGLDGA